MLNMFLQLLVFLFFIIVAYQILVQAVCLYKGVSVDEAEKIVHNFLNDEQEYHLNTDEKFCTAMDNTVKACLTQEHYERLKKLNDVEPVYNCKMVSGVHAIGVNILSYQLYSDEVNHLMSKLKNLASNYLHIHGLPSDVHAEVINDCIILMYAESQKEKEILNNMALIGAKKIKSDAKKIEAYKSSKK